MVYVLDTSVLLSDPKILERLSNKDLVIPLIVLSELEDKRSHPELGFSAREVLRTLENYRKVGKITDPVPTKYGGSLRIEINNVFDSDLPDSFKTSTNDHKILAVASNLAKTTETTLLSKDLPLRLKASVAGVDAEDYAPDKVQHEWSGMYTVQVSAEDMDQLYQDGVLQLSYVHTVDYPINSGLIVKSGSSSALARRVGNQMRLIRDKRAFDISGRSAEQRIALDLLMDPKVGIVSLGGPAGTGKSILALAAGLEAVVERRTHNKVVVFRPLYAVGGQDLGFLPGTAEEKMSPWAAAVFDALEVFCGPNVLEEVIEKDMLEVLPLTHIRGRTLTDSYVIIDEAQNLEKMVLLTALSRIGENSKVVMTHDIAQRDNLRVGKHDGISSVIDSLMGESLFGHVALVRSERSAIAELVSRLIEA
jgi:PhoH-like ATPase